ncbi:MAG: hypothetical protein HOY79_17865 [Streptomyces sp.]|nr:hypothetical protein [Streptomyces sp.]
MNIEVHRLRAGTAGFERIPNGAIFNERLSIAAIGLLNRLLADGCNHSSIDAIAEFYSPDGTGGKQKRGMGRDAYRSAAKELEAEGYLVRERVVVNGLPGWRIQVFAQPNVPNVRNVPTTAKPSSERPAETPRSPSSGPTTAEPLSVSPAETVQTPSSRPTTAQPSSFLTDFSTDAQTLAPSSQSEPPDWYAGGKEGEEVQEEGEDSASSDEVQKRAVAFVEDLPFDRRPGYRRRQKLEAVVSQALAAGWLEDDLADICVGGLESADDRIAVWMFRLDPKELGPAPGAEQDDSETDPPVEPGFMPKCHRCAPDRTITTDRGTARCPFCWGPSSQTFQDRGEIWDEARAVGIEHAGIMQPNGACKRWPAPPPKPKVPKPRQPSSGHQTYQDADPRTFRPPKGEHVGWQNPTDPNAYDGTF